MKVYIFVDMEGISGVTGTDFVNAGGPHYQTARRYYTEELNVCARACFEAGADEVIARDGHSSGNHMLWDQLDPRIQLVQGQTGAVRMWGLDGCDALILLCGHFEGVDQRALDLCVTDEISIGDFVVTGGHIAAMCFIDTVARYVPGVLGNEISAADESFENGLLEHEQYTRPQEFMGLQVPEILLSGHHANIEKYQRARSLTLPRQNRPDLIQDEKKS
jgi:hypothetical protein